MVRSKEENSLPTILSSNKFYFVSVLSFIDDYDFLVIAFICIPWMLLVNPYLDWKAEQNRKKGREVNGGDVELSRMQH